MMASIATRDFPVKLQYSFLQCTCFFQKLTYTYNTTGMDGFKTHAVYPGNLFPPKSRSSTLNNSTYYIKLGLANITSL